MTKDLIVQNPVKDSYYKGFEQPPSNRIKKVLWIESRSDYDESEQAEVEESNSEIS